MTGAGKTDKFGGLGKMTLAGVSRSPISRLLSLREGETLVVFCFRIKVVARRRIDLPRPFYARSGR
jgi:hypothetical protein